MHISTALFSCLVAFALARPGVDYGPCDYNGNENCQDIMDNTACFLEPPSADSIMSCIPGGREGVWTPLPEAPI
ncbi:hypothetical protein B0T17DRAFT_122979 [Bombardia bombarda]|uniref:Uncharacterized protein n=1 Tax=Bombardia bombarda TaxID=252184 RepID=A0AA39U0N0_9PEZI|nr:hypothetical protein B0T17DRAFT_122979 [Bombardia bombarda]